MIALREDQALHRLYIEASRIQGTHPSLRWFLFGSIITPRRPVGDIDLLVVAGTASECVKVRAELSGACEDFPFHLLLMTRNEEAELGFVSSEGAIEITPKNPLRDPFETVDRGRLF
jgi:hypothetical protein